MKRIVLEIISEEKSTLYICILSNRIIVKINIRRSRIFYKSRTKNIMYIVNIAFGKDRGFNIRQIDSICRRRIKRIRGTHVEIYASWATISRAAVISTGANERASER